MFITIDGDSGSGKTTLQNILVNRLKLEPIFFDARYEAFNSFSKLAGNFSVEARVLASLQAIFHTILPENSIIEHFWGPFLSTLTFNPSTLTKAVRFFRAGMDFVSKPEPDLSIMLDVPFEVSETRRVQRYIDGDIKITNKKKQEPNIDVRIQLYKVLESELPYFHVINNTGNINEAANSIIELLPIDSPEKL